MSLKKAAAICLIVLGLALLAGGIHLGSRDDVAIEGLGGLVICVGCVPLIGGLVLILGRDLPLTPWRGWGPHWLAMRCYVAGVAIILMSFFPLELAIRDPYYRVLSLATFGGAVLAGVGFLMAGRKLGSKVRR